MVAISKYTFWKSAGVEIAILTVCIGNGSSMALSAASSTSSDSLEPCWEDDDSKSSDSAPTWGSETAAAPEETGISEEEAWFDGVTLNK